MSLTKQDLYNIEKSQERSVLIAKEIELSVKQINLSFNDAITLKGRVEHHNSQLLKLWKKFDEIKSKNDKLHRGFEQLEEKIESFSLNKEIITRIPTIDKVFVIIMFAVMIFSILKSAK
jgi:uncharacterized coiled-coil DUF342 family protein